MNVNLCTLCAFIAENGSSMDSIPADEEATIQKQLAAIGDPLPNGRLSVEENGPCASCGKVVEELWIGLVEDRD